ncbi:MAG TPA: hypothetical protein DCW31_03830 [Lactobacillus sp.]|nr:hypothetical protein [Lactobacillus sp.]
MTIIEHYISEQPKERQEQLNELYVLLKSQLPEAQEKISYGMPTFYDQHNIIHFANMKHHLGLYPGAEPIALLQTELADYHTSKGAIQLPVGEPLPTELIIKVTQLALQRNRQNN